VFALLFAEKTIMNRFLVVTAVTLLLTAAGCRGMRGACGFCGHAEPVCGTPLVDGSFVAPPTTSFPSQLPGPTYETLPPTITN
jgi:hypothetical protein